jgi:Prolyl oligopeptidase, N-terminal beta-propeller domain
MRRLIEFLLVLTVVGSDLAVAQSKSPNAPVREVTDDYFGTKVSDPYRWLENTKDPEVIAWMKAQNDYTRSSSTNNILMGLLSCHVDRRLQSKIRSMHYERVPRFRRSKLDVVPPPLRCAVQGASLRCGGAWRK